MTMEDQVETSMENLMEAEVYIRIDMGISLTSLHCCSILLGSG